MPTSFYPPLSRLVDAKSIPGDFRELENLAQEGIDRILGQVLTKNLVTDTSIDGVTRYYSLTILCQELKLPLLGSGMNLVFFHGSTTGFSEFPIILDWRWDLYKTISRLTEGGFSALPEAFVDLLIELADIEDRGALIRKIVEVFLDDGSQAYRNFFSNLITKISGYDSGGNAGITAAIDNITVQLGNLSTEVDSLITSSNLYSIGYLYENYQDNDTLRTAVASIQTSIDVLSENFEVDIDILGDFIQSALGNLSDLDEKFSKLVRLFESWFDGITKQDLYDLVVPQFSLALQNVEVALQFPRNWLLPVVESPLGSNNWVPDPDTNKLAAVKFRIGHLKVSTRAGFEFDNQSEFRFERAMIGQTGILLQFDGLKVDVSKAYNIPEAEADGRPDDFMGLFAQSASVTLPAKWFKEPDGTNAEIFGEKLLIGTGGISGSIGLRALGGDNMFWVKLGDRSGFELGFSSFDITFKQNKVVSSNIAAAMKIARFVYPVGHPNAGQPVTIGVTGHIHDDGDFNLTASTNPAFPIELEDVFVYDVRSLELGRDDDKFYVGTCGKLEFKGFLKDTLKLAAIEVENLRIYADGSIEFKGGAIRLVEPIVLPLGPVEITVTAIHYGSHQKEVAGVMRKFNYFGFDGGVSVDPLGIEVRGDGVKYYYCTDDLPNKPAAYLHIQTLYLDLTIPATSPAVILNGWISVPEPGVSREYAGGIKLQIPRAKIAGSADMVLSPRFPAFLVDASIDLPAPIPLGPIAIYGFRGLIGYRYVAEKEAIGLQSGVHSWYDYYKAPELGINVKKFSGPDRTKFSGTPFSLGAGASLGTTTDNGTILNIKAMMLLSIPSLFMIDGRLAVLSKRLGLDDSGDPPFFAFIAVGDNSLEFGFGADFKMPTRSGDIIQLFSEVQAGFFFNDSSKWYVNFGTKQNPTTARIIRILTIKSYLMLSGRGIEAGARGELSFRRSYGPIKVAAWAYVELGGKISFERPQFGACMAAGVGADIDIKIVSLHASFDIIFAVEGAKPFRIHGEFHLCVKIKIFWVFSFRFCGDLSITWEFNSAIDRTPVNPMLTANNAAPPAEIKKLLAEQVQGISMLSNEAFPLAPLMAGIPAGLTQEVRETIIPLDTYIDFKSVKGLIPNAVSSMIGGVTNPPQRYVDLIPPQKIVRGMELRQVKHQYRITNLLIKSWNPVTANWQDYHPWKAIDPTNSSLDSLRAGQFQKVDGQYNTIRLLGASPFAYTEQGQPDWYIPEQNGLTPGVLFCEAESRSKRCADFLEKPLGQRYFCPDVNSLFYSNQVAFLLMGHLEHEFAEIVTELNPFAVPQSLRIDNAHRLQIRLPQPSVQIRLLLSSQASRVRINFFASLQDDSVSEVSYGHPDPAAVNSSAPHSIEVPRSMLNMPLLYDHPNWRPVTRIEIDPVTPNESQIVELESKIAAIEHENNLIALGLSNAEVVDTSGLWDMLAKLRAEDCEPHADQDLSNVTWVNQYLKPDMALYSSGVFEESGKPFVYAVGTTSGSALLLKTNLDGETEWAQQLNVGSDSVRFDQVIQLRMDDRYRYVLVGSDQERILLVCVDPQGQTQWMRAFKRSDAQDHFHARSTPKRQEFYFIHTDVQQNQEVAFVPQVTRMDFDGNTLAANRLQIPGISHQGFRIHSVDIHDQGLTLAGNLTNAKGENPAEGNFFNGQTVGLVVDLREDLQIVFALYVEQITLEQIVVFAPGKFVLSGYHRKVASIAVIPVMQAGPNQLLTLDNTVDMHSLLTPMEKGFYLTTQGKQQCRVHLFDKKSHLQWTERLQLGDSDLGISDLELASQFSLLSFTSLKPPVLGVSNLNLDTCITDLTANPTLREHIYEAGKIIVKSTPVDPSDFKSDERWTPVSTEYRQVCPADAPSAQSCSTLLHRICWLSLEDYQYNILIPGQAAIEEDTQAAIAALTEYIQPIWRPDTSYVVQISLQDLVDDNPVAAGDFHYTFGFSTAGPVGYFHTHPHAAYAGNPEQKPLTSLRQYIDYSRSYPNADGNLLSAKPLFYDSEITKIDLFFKHAWTRYFFYEWPAYNGLPTMRGRLKIVIKDPAEGTNIVNPPYLDFDPADTTHVDIPQTVESWQDDPNPQVPPVYQQYQHLLESQACVLVGGEVIKPKSEYVQVAPKHLKPNKLYTALVNNLYDADKDGDFDELSEVREVHKFTFQTSRYKDFEAQIQSYLLTYNDGESVVSRPAIFRITKALTMTEISAAFANVAGMANAMADSLSNKYQHRFDRLMEGIFALPPLPPAQSTEFNLIRNASDHDRIVAVLIRNPEPFNNPRIPVEQVQGTVTVLNAANVPAPGYRALFSRDYSQVVLMHNSLAITGPWNIRFQYKMWDGSAFIVPGTPQFGSDRVGTIVVQDLDFAIS